jgi:hypothetical protein
MKESYDCDCGVCSICSGLRLPGESHFDAALRRGEEKMQIENIAAVVNQYYEIIKILPVDQKWKDRAGKAIDELVKLRQGTSAWVTR